MKKRLLFILAVGLSFSPTLYADSGVGPSGRSSDFGPGATACAASGLTSTKPDDNSGQPDIKSVSAKVLAAGATQ
jgi:hypothetical protein